ncbi:hypothetical protein Ptr902_01651 [Pyrenophora tritici-repentis]|nr:hypothetical protein Ptr902_01651 [Pyrenophora tritici-repentis]
MVRGARFVDFSLVAIFKAGDCAMSHPTHVVCISRCLEAWDCDDAAKYPPNFGRSCVSNYYYDSRPGKVPGSRDNSANGSVGFQTAPRRLILGQRIALGRLS